MYAPGTVKPWVLLPGAPTPGFWRPSEFTFLPHFPEFLTMCLCLEG